MATTRDSQKTIIGRSAYLDFYDLGLNKVPSKIDTGAYRSAVHASKIKEKEGVLHYTIFGGHPVCGFMAQTLTTKKFTKVRVINSFGHSEERYEVNLKIKIGQETFNTPFTLANRSKLVFPILVGRKLLNNRFLVDTSKSSINRTELKKQFNIDFPLDEEQGIEV